MTKSSLRLILISIFLLYLSSNNLVAHEGHNKKPKMPAIGVIQGSVTDSISGSAIEYASVSIVDNQDGDVITGGLSSKDGSFNISEIPLGQYIIIVEFIGYSKKEIGPLNVFPPQCQVKMEK